MFFGMQNLDRDLTLWGGSVGNVTGMFGWLYKKWNLLMNEWAE